MRNILTAIVVASTFVVGVAAQGHKPVTPSQQPVTPSQQPATQDKEPTTRAQQPPATAAKVTIAGCVQAAPAAPPAGGAPAAPAASKFDLANAKVVSSAPVGTTEAASTAMRYRLEGDEKTISPHLNHQVEITGTLSPATATSGATATAAPTLKMESLKMVAAICPPAASAATPAQ